MMLDNQFARQSVRVEIDSSPEALADLRQENADLKRQIERMQSCGSVAEQKLRTTIERLRQQRSAIESFDARPDPNPDNPNSALRAIAEKAAQILSVERVGVWLYKRVGRAKDPTPATFTPDLGFCLAEYDRDRDRHRGEIDPPSEPPQFSVIHNVPICQMAEVVGWLRVEAVAPDWELTPDRRTVLAFLAARVALTLERFERRRIEAAFSQIHEQLESRVEKRTDELQQAVRQLRSEMVERIKTELALETALFDAQIADRTKNTFLMNMSHELRTPLHIIIGYSDILLEEVAESNRPDLAPDLKTIRQAGYNLLSLIEDLLKLSQIEAGSLGLHLETVDPEAIVLDVVTSLVPLAENNRNQLDLCIPANLEAIRTDPPKLHQILHNLLGNALKFTENGHVTLTASRESRPDGGWICFCVADTGIGMSPEQQRSLFEPFTQGDGSASRRYEGSGLGLAIARQFSQMMGGEISVSSQLGVGSSFTLKLPVRLECDRLPTATAAESPFFGEIP